MIVIVHSHLNTLQALTYCFPSVYISMQHVRDLTENGFSVLVTV